MEHDRTDSGLWPAAEHGASEGSDATEAGELPDDGEPPVGTPDGAGSTFDGAGSTPYAATGEPRVDDVLQTLASLAGRPVSEHPPVFERIHGRLVDVLGELRSGPDAAGPGAAGPGHRAG
jgi:hypothetical protein